MSKLIERRDRYAQTRRKLILYEIDEIIAIHL